MKTIVESINSSTANESVLGITLSVIGGWLIGASLGVAIGGVITKDEPGGGVFDWIKSELKATVKDAKLRRIADKIKDDPEVREYVLDSSKPGWKKMLETKLSEDDIKYINSLTRRYF